MNAIYDGYTFMPFLLGMQYATIFQHLHDYEAAPKNHWVPHYGVFAGTYFGRMLASGLSVGEKYSSFKKTSGPPNWHYSQRFDELEHNEILQKKKVSLDKVRMFEPKVRIQHDLHH